MTTASVLSIVEDEPDIRMLVRITLSSDPRLSILSETGSAEEAIEIASASHPGVIVLDHGLEGALTGLQAAPLLKQASPGSKILLFTAYDIAEDAEREPAIDAFLRKDRIGDLVATVDRLLGLDPLS